MTRLKCHSVHLVELSTPVTAIDNGFTNLDPSATVELVLA